MCGGVGVGGVAHPHGPGPEYPGWLPPKSGFSYTISLYRGLISLSIDSSTSVSTWLENLLRLCSSTLEAYPVDEENEKKSKDF